MHRSRAAARLGQMSNAIRFHQPGGADVLRWEQVDAGPPGRGEASLRQTAVGLNFLDIYERSGLYPVSGLPSGLGREGAGVVESVGPGVRNFKPGDRVAYVSSQPGAYAQERVMPVNRLVAIPDGVSDRLAAAAMLKGLTAQFLLRQTYRVRKGSAVVILAAAGGVGSIAVQWARHLGATVIAIVGSEAKAEVVTRLGCPPRAGLGTRASPGRRECARCRAAEAPTSSTTLSAGETFERSARLPAPTRAHGELRQRLGPLPPFSALELSRRGSLVSHPPHAFSLHRHSCRARSGARDLFDVIGRGLVRI